MKKSMLSTKQSYALCAIGVLVLFGILVAVCETGAISLYVKGILMTCCIAVIMTTSLNLTIGVLGQLTLGCCGFEAIGAYSAALMSKLLVANGVQMDDTVRFLLVTFRRRVVHVCSVCSSAFRHCVCTAIILRLSRLVSVRSFV